MPLTAPFSSSRCLPSSILLPPHLEVPVRRVCGGVIHTHVFARKKRLPKAWKRLKSRFEEYVIPCQLLFCCLPQVTLNSPECDQKRVQKWSQQVKPSPRGRIPTCLGILCREDTQGAAKESPHLSGRVSPQNDVVSLAFSTTGCVTSHGRRATTSTHEISVSGYGLNKLQK